jgi:hypothetical protein
MKAVVAIDRHRAHLTMPSAAKQAVCGKIPFASKAFQCFDGERNRRGSDNAAEQVRF